jgi:hypothetical protein
MTQPRPHRRILAFAGVIALAFCAAVFAAAGAVAAPAPSGLPTIAPPAIAAQPTAVAPPRSSRGALPPDALAPAPSPPSAALDPAPWSWPAVSADRVGPPPARLILDPPPVFDGAFSMNLYQRGDFVSEQTKYYCVPAAMQTMINIMSPGADRTRATQDRLYRLARKLSPKTLVGKGAEPEGWARGLEQLGFGAYTVDVQPTRSAAIKAAAKALRLSGRPVGLLVWRGAHSWVMSGFQATADPAVTNDYTVTHVDIEDVWYPFVSSIWGKSRPPNAQVPVKALREDYLPWRRPTHRYPDKDGQFVLIVPVAEGTGAAPTR